MMQLVTAYLPLICVILLPKATGQPYGSYALFECPYGWEEYEDHCYKFTKDPEADGISEAKALCQHDGAYVISVNTEMENTFLLNTFMDKYDSGIVKNDWWTSGRRENDVTAEFFWEGDGTKVESFIFWHNDSIVSQIGLNYIMYHYDGYNWGWIVSDQRTRAPYVCEIQKSDIYKIMDEERGPAYGVEDPDPATLDRGPQYLVQPEDTIFETNSVFSSTTLDCEADAYPPPSYKWTHQRSGTKDPVDPGEDKRYTMINGRLIIHDPSDENLDDGTYQCTATNDYGSILSNEASLTFGYLHDFPKSPRSPVAAISFQGTSIECNPPPHYPDVLYTWYKNDIYNFVRPDVKHYTFISHDSRLYFSEVTTDDVGNYYCLIYKPGQVLAEGKVSMPTDLVVMSGSPGIYEPVIDRSFPSVFPSTPHVGDDVRIECFATGTSNPPLVYSWSKVEYTDDGKEIVKDFPTNSVISDHDRVVTIYGVRAPYDEGEYKCTVSRQYGQTVSATTHVYLQSQPLFTLEMENQYVDVATDLSWRCEAVGSGSVQYEWLRDGVEINNETNWDHGRVSVYQNVLTILDLQLEVDDAMYQCRATNIYGTRHTSAELKVLAFAPTFSKYPLQPNQFSTNGGNTTMLCSPEAAPAITYEEYVWKKNGQDLSTSDDEDARIQKLANGNLFISPVQFSDEGVYECHVSNVYGASFTKGNLTVLESTTLSQRPWDTNVYVNHSAFIHCYASYNPTLDVTYTWYQGNMMIEFERIFRLDETRYEVWINPHFKRGSGIYNGGIYVMDAQFYHEGTYKCVVESTSDYLSAEANVRIFGPPDQPAGVYVQQYTVSTTSAMVQWKEADDNYKPVISYVVEGLNDWRGYWRILMTNIKSTPDENGLMEVNVTDLRPHSRYRLRMRAENELGTSYPSDETESFITHDVVPDKYPEEVGGGGGKVGDLTITWKPMHPWDHSGEGFGYTVLWKNKGDSNWADWVDVGGNEAIYVHLVGASNFYNEYDVAVQAFNDMGPGPESPTVTIRSAMGLPSAIASNVRAEPYNSTACIVHWNPVEDNKENIRGALGGYRLNYWRECCETEDIADRKTVSGQADQGLVIGLYPDEMYRFKVMVFNDAGNGPPSEMIPQRTLRQAPIDMPVEVQIDKKTETAIHVRWRGLMTQNEEEPLEGYKIRLWKDGEHIKDAVDYDAGRETDLRIGNLDRRVTYKLRAFGYSRGGDGALSSPALKFNLADEVMEDGSSELSAGVMTVCLALLLSIYQQLV